MPRCGLTVHAQPVSLLKVQLCRPTTYRGIGFSYSFAVPSLHRSGTAECSKKHDVRCRITVPAGLSEGMAGLNNCVRSEVER